MKRALLVVGFALAFSAQTGARAAFVSDGGFESPALASNSFAYAPAGGPWVYNNAGIINGSTGFGSTAAPEGSQYAFLQNSSGGVGSISQTFQIPSGVFSLSLLDASRAGYPVSAFSISLDGTVIGTVNPASSSMFSAYSTQFNIATSGTHTLTFTALGMGVDTTSFIDNVNINAVPEPASLALLGLGLVATAGIASRKARRRA